MNSLLPTLIRAPPEVLRYARDFACRLGRPANRLKFPEPQHAQHPISGCCGSEMFECVAADDVTKRVNLAISGFEDFRQNIEAEDNCEVAAAGVAWPQKQRKQQRKGGIALQSSINTQIAVSVQFVPIPLQNAARPKATNQGRSWIPAGTLMRSAISAATNDPKT